MKSIDNRMDIITEVKELTQNYEQLLPIETAVRLKLHRGPGNGSGNRTPMSELFIHTTIYGSGRNPMTYPKSYNEHIQLTETQLQQIKLFKQQKKLNQGSLSQGVIGFIIHDEIITTKHSRPIRSDIKKYYKQLPCIICGTSNTVCDHKNDLYNDPRVLETQTQTINDFQPLCNNCNLRKRAVSLKRDKEQKRQPPPPVILTLNDGIQFTQGDETYDPNDPNALVGTYWYDPIQFVLDCNRSRISQQINYYKS